MKRIYIAFFALLATTLCACSPTPSGSMALNEGSAFTLQRAAPGGNTLKRER